MATIILEIWGAENGVIHNWYMDNQRHRDIGPAVIYFDNSKSFFFKGDIIAVQSDKETEPHIINKEIFESIYVDGNV